MKRFWILVLVVGMLFLPCRSAIEAAAPKIQIDELLYDFGTIKEGDRVSHVFQFKNVGDGELVITDVKTSCGCTAAMTSSKTLGPGAQGTLKVNFDSKGRKGRQTKTATIHSNDPVQPAVVVRLTGNISVSDAPQIAVDPQTLDLGVLEPGETAVRRVTITNTGSAELAIEDFVGRNFVTVKNEGAEGAKRIIKPRESIQIDVEAAPEIKGGIYQGYLQIRNNSSQRIVTVPLYGYISDKYMLKPAYRK